MKSSQIKIPMENGESVLGIVTCPDSGNTETGVVIAHGAANDLNHPVIVKVAEALADAGLTVLRFNFLYREKGKDSPDSEKTLAGTWKQVFGYMKKTVLPGANLYIAAGKSLGGKIASQAVSAGELLPDALLFLGYPLHAPGRKEKLNDAHLYKISCPMLFIEGTKDPFCDREKFNGVYEQLKAPKALEWIEGGNHSYELPKTEIENQNAAYHQITDRCRNWIGKLRRPQ